MKRRRTIIVVGVVAAALVALWLYRRHKAGGAAGDAAAAASYPGGGPGIPADYGYVPPSGGSAYSGVAPAGVPTSTTSSSTTPGTTSPAAATGAASTWTPGQGIPPPGTTYKGMKVPRDTIYSPNGPPKGSISWGWNGQTASSGDWVDAPEMGSHWFKLRGSTIDSVDDRKRLHSIYGV